MIMSLNLSFALLMKCFDTLSLLSSSPQIPMEGRICSYLLLEIAFTEQLLTSEESLRKAKDQITLQQDYIIVLAAMIPAPGNKNVV